MEEDNISLETISDFSVTKDYVKSIEGEMYVNEHYFKIFYDDPPSTEGIPVLHRRQRKRYNFPLPNELSNKDYTELNNMSHESENEYVLIWDWWESSKAKINEDIRDEEKKMITIYTIREEKMKTVMKIKVMTRKVRKRKVLKRTLMNTDFKISYSGGIGDNIIVV
eukprot:184762-Ditylum_brightwellii.AAC.1